MSAENQKKKKILIIDDEEVIVETLRAKLEKEGYDVLGAYSGEKGIELARKESPHVIILDIFLPGEDGLTVLKRLKRPLDPETGETNTTRSIPVIVLTGKAEKMEEVFQMEEAFAFFTKPVNSGALLLSIQRALEGEKA